MRMGSGLEAVSGGVFLGLKPCVILLALCGGWNPRLPPASRRNQFFRRL